MDRVSLCMNTADFTATNSEAIKIAKEEFGDDIDNMMYWKDLDWSTDTQDFKDGVVTISGDIFSKNDINLGNMSVDIQLDLDTVAEIIEYYIKKVNRVKTVLEAVK